MDGNAGRAGTARLGMSVVALLAVCVVAWSTGLGIVAAVTGLAAVSTAAVVAGVDSRRPGDWSRGRDH
jgi:hypothetical protein